VLSMLHIRYPKHIHIKAESLYPLTICGFPTPTLDNHPSTCLLWAQHFHRLQMIWQYLSFCILLISLSIMCSSLIYVITNGHFFLLFKNWIIPNFKYTYTCTYIHTYISHFLYPFICQQTDCFCILAIMNNAAMNMGEQIFLSDHYLISFVYMPKQEICWIIYYLFLIKWGISVLFP
jgi:hypothetical protein